MGNSSPQVTTKHNIEEEHAPNAFDLLPRELHEVIGGFLIGSQPVRIDEILGYVLVSKQWTQTIFSGPIRLVEFNKHRVSIEALERISAFDRLSFCLDLRYCQKLGEDEDFLCVMEYPNIYELDIRGIEVRYDIDPDLGHLTSLRRLALSHTRERPVMSYSFVSKLTKLNSLIIQQDGFGTLDTLSSWKLDLNNLVPLTNLKELALHKYMQECVVMDPVTKLTGLKALVLNCGSPDFDPVLNLEKLTALTNLKTLFIQRMESMTDHEVNYMAKIKWQTSLERVYDIGATKLSKYHPAWAKLPDKKFKIGDSMIMDVFIGDYKVGFY